MQSQSVPPALPQQISRNRIFNCKMRNRHYERAYYLFRKIEGVIKTNPEIQESEQLPQLREFAEALETCLEYADASIFYGKRHKIPSYKVDRRHGLLQEEIILVIFLKEILSSVRYVINRIETDHSLQSFSDELETLKASHRADGFVERVLTSLTELKQTGVTEFAQIYSVIGRRYEIGNKLYGLLQEFQPMR